MSSTSVALLRLSTVTDIRVLKCDPSVSDDAKRASLQIGAGDADDCEVTRLDRLMSIQITVNRAVPTTGDGDAADCELPRFDRSIDPILTIT